MTKHYEPSIGEVQAFVRLHAHRDATHSKSLQFARLALSLVDQLQQEREARAERVAFWRSAMADSLANAKAETADRVARSFRQGQADAFGMVLNDIYDLERGVNLVPAPVRAEAGEG